MRTVGIICEYNPFHLGHKKQLDTVRRTVGEDCAIVCLMSGNFVQRGYPAIFDKSLRAQAALAGGADLVLELPVTYALSSAEGFAAGGVSILSNFCDTLSFGSETARLPELLETARALLRPDFPEALKLQLQTGRSFPAARQAALETMGIQTGVLSRPNDILAVEYCKAILSQGSTMEPLPVFRPGNYHDTAPDPSDPSASALRRLLEAGEPWARYVPAEAAEIFRNAPIHTLQAGQRAILYRLRTMTDEEFEALPYGSEGLWRKFMHACRSCSDIESIIEATKSKRYTRSRIDRMLMCAVLGLSAKALAQPAPYARVLGFTEVGRTVLKNARLSGTFPHTGDVVAHSYQALENRCDDIYGLFCNDAIPASGQTGSRRVILPK